MTFTLYPTFSIDDLRPSMPSVPALLPASSWARHGLTTPKLPTHITDRAANCGGFVATRIWGEYRSTPEQYVDWLSRWMPRWAATMDSCCEPELTAAQRGVIRERQTRTTENASLFWQEYRSVPWVWVPILQGWEPEDYQDHARELRPLVHEMHTHYGADSPWRVGVGTLCQRASVKMIDRVVHAIREELPMVPLHLWGVKLAALKSIDLTNIVSSDSATWHGLWGPCRHEAREAARELQMSRRTYVLCIGLPRYIDKVNAAVSHEHKASPPAVDTGLACHTLKAWGWTLRIRTRARCQYVYAVRRMGSKVRACSFTRLSELPSWSPSDLRARLAACTPCNPLGTQQDREACPTLWDNDVLGKEWRSVSLDAPQPEPIPGMSPTGQQRGGEA
jgi:hypothetical protein